MGVTVVEIVDDTDEEDNDDDDDNVGNATLLLPPRLEDKNDQR
jgi:hypothetical protein